MSFPVAIPSKEKHFITLHKEGGLYILHMHNADNRFNSEFVAALNQALSIVEGAYHSAEELEATALITIGNDKIYSNGLDLMHALANPSFMDGYLALLRRLLTFCIPTVAALNG
jgi:enoyl-CoA hydratase/carnithine racemase